MVDAEFGNHSIELMGSVDIGSVDIGSVEMGSVDTTFLLSWLGTLQQMMKLEKNVEENIKENAATLLLIPLRGDNQKLVFPETPIIRKSSQIWYLYNMACNSVDPKKTFLFY